MSGIAALYKKSDSIRNHEFETAKNILNAITHRGLINGSEHVFYNDWTMLGCNRLPMKNCASAQPIISKDGSCAVVLDGAILNRCKLAAELAITSVCDDALLLAELISRYGVDAIAMLDGEFAFIAADLSSRRLIVARDFIGTKPLYYATCKTGEVYFASEVMPLCKLTEGRVEEVPAGAYWDTAMSQPLVYYNWTPPSDRIVACDINTEALIGELRVILDECVRKRIPECGICGVYLSGGIDSSAVLATTLRFTNNILAFAMGMPESRDIVSARRLCKDLNVKLVEVSSLDAVDFVETAPLISGSFEADINRHIIGNLAVSRAARESGVRVALIGEGADELYGGYACFRHVSAKAVNKLSYNLVRDLYRTELQRVDRGGMRFAVECRAPFLDAKMISFGINAPPSLKVVDTLFGKTDKWILREAMSDRLPTYITTRAKEHFCSGAGLDVDSDEGAVALIVRERFACLDCNLSMLYNTDDSFTDEEKSNWLLLHEHGFDKAVFSKERVRGSMEQTRIWGLL